MPKTLNLTIAALLFGTLVPALAAESPLLQTLALTPEGRDDGLPQGRRAHAMSSGDFDEDGVPDLAVSYSANGSRFIALYLGNHDSIFPFSAEARQRLEEGLFHAAPFHARPQTLPVDRTFDFLAAGDFDADGHLDLAGARLGGTTIELYRGDGRGGFSLGEAIDLPGALTAMTKGEVNRRDGLSDLVVGVQSGPVAELLVFEGPEGALTRTPERIEIPSPAVAIALGELDGLSGLDIAAAAGSELVLVHGRDRKLSLGSALRESVAPAVVDRQSMGPSIQGLAFGNFSLDAAGRRELAVYTVDGQVEILQGATGWIMVPGEEDEPSTTRPRTTWFEIEGAAVGTGQIPGSRPHLTPVRLGGGVDVAVSGTSQTGLRVARTGSGGGDVADLSTGPAVIAAVPMRLNPDALTDLVAILEGGEGPIALVSAPQATITVDSTADNETGGDTFCTLREAINNANSGSDSSGGDCAAGTAGADTIEFAISGGNVETISLLSLLPGITEPVTINANTQCGAPPCIELDGSSVTDPAPDDGDAFAISGGSSVIRGFSITGFPDDGIETEGLNGGNFFEGNYIGLQPDGTTADGNQNQNVQLFSPNNTFGGTTVAARNLSSSSTAGGALQIINFDPGVVETDADGNSVFGNYLGTDIGGTLDRGNALSGVYIYEASNNSIGSLAAGAGNLISGNGSAGVLIRQADLEDYEAQNNLVQANLIGTDVNGTSSLGNDGDGVWIWFASENTVGGTTSAARNIISANGRFGVLVTNNSAGSTPTEENLVQGNFIGTDINGTADLGNADTGVVVSASNNNTVGGTVAGATNVISGNSGGGVYVGTFDGVVANGNSVLGNLIGTDATGAVAMGNDSSGIHMLGALNTTIGGTELGARNVIAANTFYGIHMQFSANDNTVQGNFIGTNSAGTAALGNVGSGIGIDNDSNNNLIGGPGSGPNASPVGSSIQPPGNLISGNTEDGILIYTGSPQNVIQGNYIGTDATGSSAVPNVRGVFSWFEGCFTLGGTNPGEGNLISGNSSYGVFPGDPNDGCVIQGNYIGLDAAGTAALGNGADGIILKGANHLVGGTVAGARNVISGNTNNGIMLIDAVSMNSTISGNYIGTNAAGTAAVSNGAAGIAALWDTSGHTIGGTAAGAGNLISGNIGGAGVLLAENNGGAGVRNITIAGNSIGTTASGLAALPNNVGVDMGFDSHDNIVGGDTAASRNVLSGNTSVGVYLSGTTTNNEVKNNYIGVGTDGATAVANGDSGVILAAVSGNTIGTTTAGNRIQSNGTNGVYLAGAGGSNNQITGNEIIGNGNTGIVTDLNVGSGNTFSQNSISGNAAFGIDLGVDGVTVNDDLDPDTGVNNLQNFPVVTSAASGSTQVVGTFNSLANSQFTLEFFSSSACDASGFGEGETYLGSIQVTTDGSGDAAFDRIFGPTAPVGHFVTSTATAADGSTSEFSACVQVTAGDFDVFEDGFESGNTNAWTVTVP